MRGDLINLMIEPSRYWNILIISGCDRSYESREIIGAKNYFERLCPDLATQSQLSKQDDRNMQRKLLDIFINSNDQAEKINAGLCLRCYISYGIVKAIKTLVKQFGTEYLFTMRDILDVVLQDDGREKIILDEQGKNQILIDSYTLYSSCKILQLFAIQIIAQFNFDRSSLENWAYYKTRHNDDLKEYLRSEYGLLLATNWAILNRVNKKKLLRESQRNVTLIKVYHQVCRCDRLQNKQRGKCSEPTQDQLSRMIVLLKEQNIIIDYTEDLLEELNQLGEYFRELEINPELMIANNNNDPDPDPLGLKELLEPHLERILENAIAHTFSKFIQELKNSRGYSNMVDKFNLGYRLIYVNKMTITQVSNELGFTGQSQASRVLRVERFITEVGNYMYDQIMKIIGDFVSKKGGNFNPDILQNISQDVSDYIAEKVTLPAINELKSGRKSPAINSLFAQKMREYLSTITEGQ